MAATPPLPDLVLYSRPGCELCDEARATVQGLLEDRAARSQRLARLRELDISSDPTSSGRCSTAIPVLELGGAGWSSRRRRARIRRFLADQLDTVRGMSGDNLTILVAFAAGLLSFLSPCVLPLVPAYLGQLTAVAVAGERSGRRAQPLARASARVRLRPGLRRGVHAARRDRDVRRGRPSRVPADAPGDRRRHPRRPRPEPRRDSSRSPASPSRGGRSTPAPRAPSRARPARCRSPRPVRDAGGSRRSATGSAAGS